MTSIKGYIDVLLLGAAGDLTEQQAEFLGVVKSNTERLNVLVNDLLDVSHIEAGRVNLSVQPVDLHDLAEGLVQETQARAVHEGKAMTIDLQAAGRVSRVVGDPERIRQILANLVENAYNYTPPDGHILLRLQQVGEEVQVDVQDTGVGISPEDKGRVFDRFFRGEDPLVLATAGTGLGLSIVRELVQMHGGRIWFESPGKPGHGSTFSFTLPVYHARNED